MQFLMRSIPLLLTVAALAACKDSARDSAPSAKTTSPTVARPPAAAAVAAEAPASEGSAVAPSKTQPSNGAAYLGVSGTGLVRVEGGKAKTLIEHKYPI